MEQRQVQVRSSTVSFLVFTNQAGEESINLRVHEGTLCLSQKAMARLFDSSTSNISRHLKKVYEDAELQPERTMGEYSIGQQGGGRSFARPPSTIWMPPYGGHSPTPRMNYNNP